MDGSNISAYYVHECEAVNRTGLRSRRFVFTGHVNGSVQVVVAAAFFCILLWGKIVIVVALLLN